MSSKSRFKRVLLKLSGESLSSPDGFGIDPSQVIPIIKSISHLHSLGIEIAIVVGGGNFLRGSKADFKGMVQRATADQMGMLATMMNALALRDLFINNNIKSEVLSSKAISGVMEAAGSHIAKKMLQNGNIVIFAGGTGNPFVTTDSTASLRAVEIEADAILKATTVDGVFDSDPNKFRDAKKYNWISFDDIVKKELAVMDLGAFTQCRDFNIPICVFNMDDAKNLLKVLFEKNIGTWVSKEMHDD